MLASITPLGERSRGSSWGLTVASFAAAAIGAGALAGALLGGLGEGIGGGGWRGWLAAGALLAAVLFEAPLLRHRLPSCRRQVNEDWLGRYRGWVYGAGFGAQLGVGVATIVTTATIYAAAAIAVASARPSTGALIGASFGTVRALSLLPGRRVRDPQALAELHRALGWAEPAVRGAAVLLELLALAAAVAWLA